MRISAGFGIRIKAEVGGATSPDPSGYQDLGHRAVKGTRCNVEQPKNIINAGLDCVPQLPTPGLDVIVMQTFKRNRARVKTLRVNTTTSPRTTCGAPSSRRASGSPTEVAILVVGAEAEPVKEASRRCVRFCHLQIHGPYAAGPRRVGKCADELTGDTGAPMILRHV